MVSCMMKQSEEKHILGTATTEILLWSSRRDLIAVSNSSGEVFLRRLSWNKVWKLVKRGDGVKVSVIAWRPDSVVLAVGYTSGHVVLVDVESGEIIHTFNPTGAAITSLTWENSNSPLDPETLNFMQSKLLPSPSKLDGTTTGKSDGSLTEEEKTIKNEEVLSLLWIGMDNGTLHAYAFGLFPCCTLNLSDVIEGDKAIGAIREICPNFNQSQVAVLAELRNSRSEMLLMNVETPLISSCLKELYVLGVIYRQINALIETLTGAQKALHEAWEDALVDLESKMARYDGESKSLSVDLMELLMFGYASPKLEKFLVTELTDKGLKRIGQAVELSYTNMQKLLVKNITCANYQLSHLLTQLCGLAKQEDRFSFLGLQLDACLAAYRAAGSFTAKTAELQQVIDGSIKYLRTFFRWLYVTILRLSDEPVPQELATSTQQDVRFIANFLAKDFESDGHVRLDRIGQYLRNEPLTFVTSSKNRPWDMLVEACPSIAALQDADLFQPRAERSLAQEFAELEARIASSFQGIPSSVGKSATLPFNIGIQYSDSEEKGKIRTTTRSINTAKDKCSLLVMTDSLAPARGFYLFEFSNSNSPKAAYFTFDSCQHLPQADKYLIEDIELYSDEILSILLSGGVESGSVFLQLNLNLLREELLPVVSNRGPVASQGAFIPSVLNPSNVRSVDVGAQIEPSSFRLLPHFQASSMGLSSSRKVAAIFSSVKRKIRIFDMEVDEEEEEEDPSDISHGTCKSDDRKDISDVEMAVSP